MDEDIIATIKKLTSSQQKLDEEQITLRGVIEKELGIDNDPRNTPTIRKLEQRIINIEQQIDTPSQDKEMQESNNTSSETSKKDKISATTEENEIDNEHKNIDEGSIKKLIHTLIINAFKRYRKSTKNILETPGGDKKEKKVVKDDVPVVVQSFSINAIHTLEQLFKKVFKLNINLNSELMKKKSKIWLAVMGTVITGMIIFWNDIKKKIEETDWKQFWDNISNKITSFLEAVDWEKHASVAAEHIINMFTTIINAITVIINDTFDNLGNFKANIKKDISNILSDAWKNLKESFKSLLPEWVKNIFGLNSEPMKNLNKIVSQITDQNPSLIGNTNTGSTDESSNSEASIDITKNVNRDNTEEINMSQKDNAGDFSYTNGSANTNSNIKSFTNLPESDKQNFGNDETREITITKKDGEVKKIPLHKDDSILFLKQGGFIDKKLDSIVGATSRFTTHFVNGMNNINNTLAEQSLSLQNTADRMTAEYIEALRDIPNIIQPVINEKIDIATRIIQLQNSINTTASVFPGAPKQKGDANVALNPQYPWV